MRRERKSTVTVLPTSCSRAYLAYHHAVPRKGSPALGLWRLGFLVSLLLLALGAAGVRAAGEDGTLNEAAISETLLPNGLRLVVKEAHATDLAAIQVWIRAGGYLESEANGGIAHVIEHLVFKGSDARSGTIDSEVEPLGGLVDATTEKDWTHFACTLNGRYAERVLTAIGGTLKAPRFTEADLAAEKPLMLTELAGIPLSPEALLSRSLFRLAYQKHPYAHDVRGARDFVENVSLASVKAFYQQHYVPANMVVVVVGDVDRASIERVTRQVFGNWPAPGAASKPGAATKPAGSKLPPDEVPCAKSARELLPVLFTGSAVGIAYPAPSVREEPDTHAMDLILTLLENPEFGRITRILKGQYPFWATYETRRQPGLFTLIVQTGKDDPEPVEALLRKEMDFLANRPISPQELALAKSALRGSYALDNESYSRQAGTLGYYAAIDKWQFASSYLEKIDAITVDQVQETARKYLDSEHSVTVLQKPRNAPPARPNRSA